MTEFLFEIFCEEIPARMQVKAGRDLEKALVDGLMKAGLTVEGVHHWAGPRRLGFKADIPLNSPDVSEERKGPRVGAPEQALAGFMRGAGLSDISEAEIRSDNKGEHYVAVIDKPGRASPEIIAELIPEVMNNFPWPKSMKSGRSNFRWVRPLQSMICLLGGDVIPVEVGGIIAGNTTEGHRRHGRGPFIVSSYADYKEVLESKGHVLLEFEDRKAKILHFAKSICMLHSLELVEDEGLLAEVAGLAEWPVVILGDMDPKFLELPGEVIRLSMRTHQKYFTVKKPDGSLAPNFIVVANQVAPDGGQAIASGNSRVLSARLDDARFFQAEDAKKNLIEYYDKLDTVVFHKKLGSVKDKAERVAALARELAPKVGADPDLAEEAAKLAKCDLVTQTVIEFTSLQGQIGRLMYERENGLDQKPPTPNPSPPRGGEDSASPSSPPSPQNMLSGGGTEGGGQSNKTSIAVAIEDHYKPQGPSDNVPTDPVAVAVALADKLDTLVGFWAIDEKPTGSKDPFALRRAALGVVRIILENEKRINFIDIIPSIASRIRHDILYNTVQGLHFYSYWTDDLELIWPDQEVGDVTGGFLPASISIMDTAPEVDIILGGLKEWELDGRPIYEVDKPEVGSLVKYDFVYNPQQLITFIADRLKVYLRDKGIRHDLIDAVFALGEDDLVSIVNRVEALQFFLGTEDGENLLAGYKRAANILKAEAKKSDLPEGAPNRPDDPYGADLYDALSGATGAIETALKDEDYAAAMLELAKLRAPIDAFFTNVMIISDDIAVKENNLRLLGRLHDTAAQIADFDAIQG